MTTRVSWSSNVVRCAISYRFTCLTLAGMADYCEEFGLGNSLL